jgi:hypothetical protein
MQTDRQRREKRKRAGLLIDTIIHRQAGRHVCRHTDRVSVWHACICSRNAIFGSGLIRRR